MPVLVNVQTSAKMMRTVRLAVGVVQTEPVEWHVRLSRLKVSLAAALHYLNFILAVPTTYFAITTSRYCPMHRASANHCVCLMTSVVRVIRATSHPIVIQTDPV